MHDNNEKCRGYWLGLLTCGPVPHSGEATGKRAHIVTLWESSECSRHQHPQVTRRYDCTTRVATIANPRSHAGGDLMEKSSCLHRRQSMLLTMIQNASCNNIVEKHGHQFVCISPSAFRPSASQLLSWSSSQPLLACQPLSAPALRPKPSASQLLS